MKTSWLAAISLLVASSAFAQTINNQQNPFYAADAINPQSSTYGGSTYAGELFNNTQGEGAQQWHEAGFLNSVSIVANANACLGATGSGLTMIPTACVAYDGGFRNSETGSITFPGNGTYWVAIDSCSQTGPPTSLCTHSNAGLPNFTRVSGTHYLIDSIDIVQPAMAANSQLLMKVTAAGGSITAVTDLRKTGVVFTTGSANFIGNVNGVLVPTTAKGDAIFSGDGVHASDGTTNGTTTFTSSTGAFTAALVGDDIFIDGAGSAGALYVGTVASVTNATTLVLSSTPSTNISGTAHYVIGFDNTTILQAWLNLLRNEGTNSYGQLPGSLEGYLPAGVYLHRGLNFGGSAGVKITGAGWNNGPGGNIVGGSTFLCIDPTTSPTGCHDFTGLNTYELSSFSVYNGTSTAEAGIWNALFARLTNGGAGYGIYNAPEHVNFHSYGTYNVVLDNSEQNFWVNDGFNANLDPAKALYITTSTSTFSSPFYGALTSATQSATINYFLGGQVSMDGANGVTIDGSPNNVTFDGTYFRAQGSTESAVADSADNTFIGGLTINNVRFEPDNVDTTGPTNRLVNFSHSGSVIDFGEFHNDNIAYPSGVTSSVSVINDVGGMSMSHVSALNIQPNIPNPEITIGSASSFDSWEDVNGPWIQIGGTPLAITTSQHNFLSGPLAVYDSNPGGDTIPSVSYNAASGGKHWTQYNSATGTTDFWGAGGMGWGNDNQLVGGFTLGGTFMAGGLGSGHYGCRTGNGSPGVTNGTLTGCDSFGEINVTNAASPVVVTFNIAYANNVACALTDDGAALFWYAASKSGTGFTAICSTLTGSACSGAQNVTYNCGAIGAP